SVTESATTPGSGAMGGMGGGASSTATERAYIPLAMVATITREIGANEIAIENGRLRAYVQANVQDRDLGGFVNDIEAALHEMDWGNMTWSLTGERSEEH